MVVKPLFYRQLTGAKGSCDSRKPKIKLAKLDLKIRNDQVVYSGRTCRLKQRRE